MFIPVRSAGGGLTGKAAFQAARFRRVPIANWQHWDWQHFHIGYILRYILPGATKIARQLQKLVDGVPPPPTFRSTSSIRAGSWRKR